MDLVYRIEILYKYHKKIYYFYYNPRCHNYNSIEYISPIAYLPPKQMIYLLQ